MNIDNPETPEPEPALCGAVRHIVGRYVVVCDNEADHYPLDHRGSYHDTWDSSQSEDDDSGSIRITARWPFLCEAESPHHYLTGLSYRCTERAGHWKMSSTSGFLKPEGVHRHTETEPKSGLTTVVEWAADGA